MELDTEHDREKSDNQSCTCALLSVIKSDITQALEKFSINNDDCPKIVAEDWFVSKAAVEVLWYFESLTLYYSITASSISDVLLHLLSLMERLVKEKIAESKKWNFAIDTCHDKLLKYFEKSFNND